jgi:hypothetical protein
VTEERTLADVFRTSRQEKDEAGAQWAGVGGQAAHVSRHKINKRENEKQISSLKIWLPFLFFLAKYLTGPSKQFLLTSLKISLLDTFPDIQNDKGLRTIA